ncbi:unnamed protein product [Aphanomyces euteiches]|uniref:Glutathione peroxidase n=1 Tax=Aphanomyces euteiches TaxID=100861 RepID=A0A6G0XRM9_9STRA|nr:hypothetical protein Ae201684_002061 [Aphanomyces euteiches]KAH9086583.1 hypothetical protein Ae201684P_000005 [Aphanomyces euteiches]KAH9157004.1 hypothetical protein AeRB84_001107 [Aphanomyces euteiches]
MASFFELTCTSMDGETVSMEKYRGYVCLVVNVASKCGLTQVNYTQLAALDKKYRDHGLRILAFPSHQFAEQEFATHGEIQQFVSTFGVTFPLFAKADVTGPNAQPIFEYLGTRLGAPKWNFTKYLITRDGQPFKKYNPKIPPFDFESDIVSLLHSKL